MMWLFCSSSSRYVGDIEVVGLSYSGLSLCPGNQLGEAFDLHQAQDERG